MDPWWGITEKASASEARLHRSRVLGSSGSRALYLRELGSAEGLTTLLGSPIGRPVLAGIQTNLYMVFMDTTWRQISRSGVIGLLHQEAHFGDPNAGELRRATYQRLKFHVHFVNELPLFEDIENHKSFGLSIYGPPGGISFRQFSWIVHPDTIASSLSHDGSGSPPTIQHPEGGWDLRPHRSRVVDVGEEVLADWARLFDETGTPPAEARLLRPVSGRSLCDLHISATDQASGRCQLLLDKGIEEDRSKRAELIVWDTHVHLKLGTTSYFRAPTSPQRTRSISFRTSTVGISGITPIGTWRCCRRR